MPDFITHKPNGQLRPCITLWRQHETIERFSEIINGNRLDVGFLDNLFPRHLWSCPAGREVRDLLMSNIQIIHGDCMEAMAKMPDKAYELAIVDPPYGINENGGRNLADRPTIKWKNPNSQVYKIFDDSKISISIFMYIYVHLCIF